MTGAPSGCRDIQRILSLAASLALSGCGQLGNVPPTTTPPAPPPPPQPAFSAPPLVRLDNRTVRAELPLSQLFIVDERLGSSAQVNVSTGSSYVVDVRPQGSGLATVVVIERAGPGNTTVEVTLRTSAGHAVQNILVRVVADPEAPHAVDRHLSIHLRERGGPKSLPITDVFSVGARHSDSVVVEVVDTPATASVRLEGSGVRTVVVLEPLRVGDDHLLLRMSSAAGSAAKRVLVTVVAPQSEPPRPDNRFGPVTLTDGGAPVRVFLASIFRIYDETGRSETEAEAQSENPGVATVSYQGELTPKHLLFAPVRPGTTSVVVTAGNAAGSATLRLPVTVREAEPLRVSHPFGPVVFLPGRWIKDTNYQVLFEPPGYRVEARSENERVVRVDADPFANGGMALRPGEPGETNVVVTARNAVSEARFVAKVTVLEKLRIGLFNGLGSRDAPVRLVEGAQWRLDIRALNLEVDFLSEEESLLTFPSVGVVTDAPPTELQVPESVPGDPLGSAFTPISIPVVALADDVAGEPDASYSISLAPVPGLPSWVELSETPVRVVVVDSPAAACEDLEVLATVDRGPGAGTLGTIVIQSPHRDTSVSIAAPYLVRPTGQYPLATHLVPEQLPLRETADGFEQTVRLRWWGGDLRLAVEAPGCEPVQVVCDRFACSVE